MPSSTTPSPYGSRSRALAAEDAQDLYEFAGRWFAPPHEGAEAIEQLRFAFALWVRVLLLSALTPWRVRSVPDVASSRTLQPFAVLAVVLYVAGALLLHVFVKGAGSAYVVVMSVGLLAGVLALFDRPLAYAWMVVSAANDFLRAVLLLLGAQGLARVELEVLVSLLDSYDYAALGLLVLFSLAGRRERTSM